MFPDSIDRYQIQSEIARGGMAIIYLAYDPQHNRDVAIKVLPQEYLYSSQFRARFQREIEIMISIRHPGIVPIYGYGQFQGQLYLVMRYMAGGSLEELIEQQGTLSIGETASLVGKIAPILESAHHQGVIHRDLKPSNILFDEEGQPFISDFGIARLTEQSNIAALTGKSLIGSPAYMSPEQGRIGITLDGRSDIYSLGVMVFEMLTGQLPFDAETPMQLVLKHILRDASRSSKPRWQRIRNKGIPMRWSLPLLLLMRRTRINIPRLPRKPKCQSNPKPPVGINL
jgi:serine/threonine-protein kinase